MKYFIIGAGGLARELESWVSQTADFSSLYELEGFLDDNLNSLDNVTNQFKVKGTLEGDIFFNSKNVLFGIASPEVKKKLFCKINLLNINILNFSHHSSIVGKNNILGNGYVFCPNSVITCNVEIGEGVFINLGSQIGHDVFIGNYTSIMANVDIGGGAVIGKEVFIGSNSVILPGVKVPDNTIIGAGSVVIKSIKSSGTYFGNPAKKIF